MNITLTAVPSRNKEKIWYTFEWGKGAGQRKAAIISMTILLLII